MDSEIFLALPIGHRGLDEMTITCHFLGGMTEKSNKMIKIPSRLSSGQAVARASLCRNDSDYYSGFGIRWDTQ